jgi:hypothetical protein
LPTLICTSEAIAGSVAACADLVAVSN